MIVIDESHNSCNGIGTHSNEQENRYQKLMEKVICAGIKTKVFDTFCVAGQQPLCDLKYQCDIDYEGNSDSLDERLNMTITITFCSFWKMAGNTRQT